MTPFEASRPQDKLLILRRVPVFISCTDEQLQFIADRTRLIEYKKGEVLYRQGEKADGFYIVSTGRLRVFSDVEGREETVTVLHNGDSFGEMSLLLGESHSATVQAINDTLVLSLPKQDFEDVINRIPSLVLYLSRLLSKRLRTRQRGDEFSESTIVALYSGATGVGRTSFAVALATQLRRETEHEVVMVDFSAAEAHPLLYGAGAITTPARHTLSEAASEGAFDEAVADHPLGFQVLLASDLLTEEKGEQVVAPLLSFLTKRFQYILIDLPADLNAPILKALSQSDLIYLVTDSQPEHLIRTNALLHRLQASMGPVEQRIKVVLNLREELGAGVSLRDVVQQIRQPVAFTLPYVSSVAGRLTVEEFRTLLESPSPYMMTVRRTARELGGLLVGLALGSGAALGLAHIGVLKVIERERIPIDIIAGSSIGAVVAGLWACGRSAAELEQMAMEFKNPWDIRRLFLLDFGIPVFSLLLGAAAGIGVGMLAGFWTGLMFGFMVSVAFGLVMGPIAGGPIQGARLMAKLEQDFGGKTFEETWLPLKVVAANPMAREEVIFDSGPVAPAVRASVSIPGIFKPVILQGKVCLDGGVVNPIPVSVVKRSGANHVIAVNVFPTTPELIAHRQELVRKRAEKDAALASRSLPFRLLFRIRQELIRSVSPIVFDVIMRSMQSMEHQIAEVACREADIVLRPTVPGSHWLEFFNPEKFIRRGEEVTLQHLPELKRLTQGRHVDNP